MLTILIPTYNRPKTLAVALQSIVAGFDPLPKVIIGDNGDAQVTEQLLTDPKFASLPVRHLKNPTGSTYVQNLQWLVNACDNDWLCILHDDDFFVGNVSEHITPVLNDPNVVFVFTDHWVADNEGKLLENETEHNSINDRRSEMEAGAVNNLTYLFIDQRICLDGFYVRSSVAQACEFASDMKIFSDGLWLTDVTSKCTGGWYLSERTFAYRFNAAGLTARQFDRRELLDSLVRAKPLVQDNPTASSRLKERIRQSAISALKQSLKQKSVGSGLRSLKTLVAHFG